MKRIIISPKHIVSMFTEGVAMPGYLTLKGIPKDSTLVSVVYKTWQDPVIEFTFLEPDETFNDFKSVTDIDHVIRGIQTDD